MVPSSPRSAPIPGRYTFNLIKEGGTRSIDVRAIVKVADGEPQTGELDINVCFAKLSDLDAGRAQSDGDFFNAAIAQVLGVGMALAAVTDDHDLAFLDQFTVGVGVVINFHVVFPIISIVIRAKARIQL